ncbi:hypothetical protein LCGC14_2706940 [marine sediment metagenome]|uniref:Uncharacterized protein n=1 Tax=marine sediment metagenome TaxID=412755 RepID=A0A0F8ZE69_9ZZZZ
MMKKSRPDWVEAELGRTKVSKKKRGSTNNESRLQGFGKSNASNGADWSSCDAHRMLSVICAITDMGGAVTIGKSRDGGSHMMTLLLDDDRRTLWFNGDAVLDDEMDMVLGILNATT